MGKATFAIVASFVALMVVAGVMLQSLVVLQHIAAVGDLQGDVKLTPAGEYGCYPLNQTRYVKSGDVLQTGEGSVTLNWVDGTRIRIGPRSTLKVLKCQLNSATKTTTSLFQLDVGRVWVRVMKALNPRSKFEIATPTVTAGVRGTVFGVTVDKLGHTAVDVLEGQVVVRAGARHVIVDKNCAVKVLASPSKSNPTHTVNRSAEAAIELANMDKEQLEAWKQQQDLFGPYLALLSPQEDEAPVEKGQIVVTGVAELGATVTVNGQAIKPGPRGKFRVLLPAPSGPKLKLKLEAVDAQQRHTLIEKTLRVTKAQVAPAVQ